jgi:hypothetical protein
MEWWVYALFTAVTVNILTLKWLKFQYEDEFVAFMRSWLPTTRLNTTNDVNKWATAVRKPSPTPKPRAGNSHKHAAAAREAAVKHIEAVQREMIVPEWALSMSARQLRNKVAGQRFMYHGKDFINYARVQASAVPRKGHLVTAIDVLNHLPRKTLTGLMDTDNVVVSYDRQVRAPGGRMLDGAYTYDRKDKTFTFVGENFTYPKEKLLDWNPEGTVTLHFRSPWKAAVLLALTHVLIMQITSWLTAPWVASLPWVGTLWCYTEFAYKVPFVRLDLFYYWTVECDDGLAYWYYAGRWFVVHLIANAIIAHYSVRVTARKILVNADGDSITRWFIPTRRAYGYIGMMYYFLAGMGPGYVTPDSYSGEVKGKKMEFDVMRTVSSAGDVTWRFSLPGMHTHWTVTEADVATTRVHMATARTVGAGSMATFCEGNTSQVQMDALIALLTIMDGVPKMSTYREFVAEPLATFSFIDDALNEENDLYKPRMRKFMGATVHDRVVAANSEANKKRAVEARVLAPTSAAGMNDFDRACVYAFNARIVGQAGGMLNPASDEEVDVRQNRPAQRNILADGRTIMETCQYVFSTLRDFLKRESGDPNDPRLIGQFADESAGQKAYWSAVCISLTTLFKPCRWYAFGKSPTDVADSVTGVFQGEESALLTDCSRMDATINLDHRWAERELLLACFNKRHHAKISAVHQTMYDRKRRLGETVYENSYRRVSGEPGTSAMNTYLKALCFYTAYVSAGCSYEQAWDLLGVYGGDDGASRNVFKQHVSATAIRHGLKLKMVEVHKDAEKPLDRCVEFLSRRFMPWNGDNNSCACTLRLLAGMPTTGQMDVEPSVIAFTKASSIILNDGNSPYVGPLLRRLVTDLQGTRALEDVRNISWWGHMAIKYESGFPNEYQDWMLAAADQELMFPASADFHAWAAGEGHWSSPPLISSFVPDITLPINVVTVDSDRNHNENKATELTEATAVQIGDALAAADAAPLQPIQEPVMTRRDKKRVKQAKQSAPGENDKQTPAKAPKAGGKPAKASGAATPPEKAREAPSKKQSAGSSANSSGSGFAELVAARKAAKASRKVLIKEAAERDAKLAAKAAKLAASRAKVAAKEENDRLLSAAAKLARQKPTVSEGGLATLSSAITEANRDVTERPNLQPKPKGKGPAAMTYAAAVASGSKAPVATHYAAAMVDARERMILLEASDGQPGLLPGAAPPKMFTFGAAANGAKAVSVSTAKSARPGKPADGGDPPPGDKPGGGGGSA